MDQQTLLETLKRLCHLPREAATVEFKLNWDHAADIGKYLSALGNAAALEGHDRAWMVWGVHDKSHEVKGTHFNPFTTKGEGNQPLIMWLTQKISPRPDFRFYELNHPREDLGSGFQDANLRITRLKDQDFSLFSHTSPHQLSPSPETKRPLPRH
jgi:ATP-dependent DNA helicase RecG